MNEQTEMIRYILTTNHSDRLISRSLGVSKTTVGRYRRIALKKQYRWEDLKELDDEALVALFNRHKQRAPNKRLPDYVHIHQERQKRSVTTELLWLEYRDIDPETAYSYSQFNFYYMQHAKKNKLTMRQSHEPGKCAFVDFSGKRPFIVDQRTGQRTVVEIFVAVLGYSGLLFVLAVLSQKLRDWLDSHERMLEFYGGVTEIVMPDNLKSAVTFAGRQAKVNQTYREFGQYYGFMVVPARPRKPQDKAAVENGVRLAQRWVLAPLRNQTFFSLHELNCEIAKRVAAFNDRPRRNGMGSRRALFDETERPLLGPLPSDRFHVGEWLREVTVGPDYHVCVDKHWYSVPFKFVGEKVSARDDGRTIELYCHGRRIASHGKSANLGGKTTSKDHMPSHHRAWAERTPERFKQWADEIGPSTARIVQQQLDTQPLVVAMQAYDGLIQLAAKHGKPEIEAAATYALQIKSWTMKSLRSILRTGKHTGMPEQPLQLTMPLHENLRGPDYYAGKTTNGGTPC